MDKKKRKFSIFPIVLFCLFLTLIPLALSQRIQPSSSPNPHAISKINRKNDLIFLNTIDGKMHAVGRYDGKIKWSIKEDSVIKFSKNNENPYFLTDPRDGSLYIFTSKEDGGLKKFPYTIAELVSASPSKSSDGFLYTGDKKDQWLAIDYRNGLKLDTLTAETLSSKISIADENVVFIGRTQYTISMFDISTRKKIFNMTYYDYSTHSASMGSRPEQPTANINTADSRRYPFYHFTSNSDGTLVTLDKTNGDFRWKLKLKHPVIAMYRYENEQLFKVNFQVFAKEALANLNAYKLLYKQQKYEEKDLSIMGDSSSAKPKKTTSTFKSTLYVGFYDYNLYALPSLVYNSKSNLIEGPVITNSQNDQQQNQHQIIPFPLDIDEKSNPDFSVDESNETRDKSNIIGHHKLPDQFEPPSDYIQPNKNLVVIASNTDENTMDIKELFSGQINKQEQCLVEEPKRMSFFEHLDNLMQNKYIWSLFTVMLASLFPLTKTIYDYRKKRARQLQKLTAKQQQMVSSSEEDTDEIDSDDVEASKFGTDENKSSNSSRHSMSRTKSRNSSNKSILHESASAPVMNGDHFKIGKITVDMKGILGYGCAGTTVFKGTFEKRAVAVKRLLPECWTLADREVDLLRDADQHQNVLRYFCTEADSQFRYIALELCQMTLNDYIKSSEETLSSLNILEQTTKGLDHLHNLHIVHRDIKPHNVLVSFPNSRNEVKVMISDFGLCKRLEGKNFFSNRSGVTGTEGWTAPEIIKDLYDVVPSEDENSSEIRNNLACMEKKINNQMTKSVDIFSLGCVYYYVLSSGNHPFGDLLTRQFNILSNKYKLDKLSSTVFSELHAQKILIDKMISSEPNDRPMTKEILTHPIFWSNAKTLQFLLETSDRIENEALDSELLVELSKNANVILKNNWKSHICKLLAEDLNKFRKYNGVYIRDLLRAIRNKKHHYQELPENVKNSLGTIPDEYVTYFTSRFPKLVLHVYRVMYRCRCEPIFQSYYNMIDT